MQKTFNPNKSFSKKCTYCFHFVSYNKGEKPECCPHCGRANYIKTPTELELFELQDKYLTAINDKNNELKDLYLGKIFVLLKKYATGKIKKNIKNVVSFDVSRLEEKASDAAYDFIEYYMKDKEFKVEQSFGALLEKKVKQALYNVKQKRNDGVMSIDLSELNSYQSDDEVDLLNQFSISEDNDIARYDKWLLQKSEEEDLLRSIEVLLKQITKRAREVTDDSTMLHMLVGLYMFICGKDEDEINSYCQKVGGIRTREMIDMASTVLLSFLKDNAEHGGLYSESTVL